MSYDREAHPSPKSTSAQSSSNRARKHAGAAVQHKKQDANEAFGMTIEAEAEGALPYEEFRDAADAGGAAEKQSMEQQEQNLSTTPIVFQLGNHRARDRARQMIDTINGFHDNLAKGIHDGMVPPDALSTNTNATLVLGDFLVTAGEQARTVVDFQSAYRTAKIDSARLFSQLELLQKTSPGLQGNFIAEWGGEKRIQRDTASVSAVGQGQGGIHWASMQSQHTELEHYVSLAGSAQQAAVASRHRVSAALNQIEGGIVTTEKNPVEGQEILQCTGAIKKVIGFAIEKSFEHFEIPGATIATGAAEMVVDAVFVAQLRLLDAKTQESEGKQKHGLTRALVETLRANLAEWAGHVIECYAARKHIATLKGGLRDSARQFAAAAGEKNHFEVGIIAEVYAEADTLLQQIKLAIGLGKAAGTTSAEAAQDRLKVFKMTVLSYYEPVKTYSNRMMGTFDPRTVGLTYEARKGVMRWSSLDGDTKGDSGVEPVIEAAMADLTSSQQKIEAVRDRLATALGFSKTSDRDSAEQVAKGAK